MFAGPNIPASTYRDRTARNAVADDAREGVSPSDAELAEAAGQADRARHESGDGALRPVRAAGDEASEPSQRALRLADGHETVRAELAEAMRVIAFEVLGCPAPKGSNRAFFKPGMKRAVMIPGGSDTNKTAMRSWESAVRYAANECAHVADAGAFSVFVDVALSVTIVFHVQRPKSAKKKARPASRPDIDKLARCTLDAMHGSIFDDDSRICDLVLSKRWAEPGREGASITVSEATP